MLSCKMEMIYLVDRLERLEDLLVERLVGHLSEK